jgi:hypothetical protein
MVALFIAPAAFATTKSRLWHGRWGRVYIWAMLVIFMTGSVLLMFRFNPFFFVLNVFSLHQVMTGFRVLKLKENGFRARWFDWTLAAAGLPVGLACVVLGGAKLLGVPIIQDFLHYDVPRVVLIPGVAIGAYLVFAVCQDIMSFLKPVPDSLWWLRHHISRLIASYIAEVTAFLVSNGQIEVPMEYRWIFWMGPALVGAPILILWVMKYRPAARISQEGQVQPKPGLKLRAPKQTSRRIAS